MVEVPIPPLVGATIGFMISEPAGRAREHHIGRLTLDGRYSPCFRSREYNCVREMPNCRAPLDTFPLTSRMARSIVRRSTTFKSVLSSVSGTLGAARDES